MTNDNNGQDFVAPDTQTSQLAANGPVSTDNLQERAKTTLLSLETGTINKSRPLFVEFSGTPKSGKSTCIDIVAHFFRRLGYKVLAPTEGASKRTPYYLKDDLLAFNTWSASYALMHVLEGLHGSDKYHLAILDRGLFDALAWFELLLAQDNITATERDHIHNFLRISKWRSVIDMVLVFTADPETSMQREQHDKLIEEPGRAMNPEFLQQLNDAYNTIQGEYADDFRLIPVDTSNEFHTEPRSTAAEAVKRILDALDEHVGSRNGQ